MDVINYVSSVDYLALANDAKIDAVKGDSVYIMNLQLDQREKTPLVRAIDGSELDHDKLEGDEYNQLMHMIMCATIEKLHTGLDED